MPLPYKISTLLYAFDPSDRILLLERTREPNRGLWSPPGGKLDMSAGESPYACACREAAEELNLKLRPSDLHLTGLVSEHGYQFTTHWLMFLFEVRPRLRTTPDSMAEGRFAFFARNELRRLPLPQTDRDSIWPLFWKHRGGFFSAHCHCHANGLFRWKVEESLLPPLASRRVAASPSGGGERSSHRSAKRSLLSGGSPAAGGKGV
jgi:8-oxo-dGTP diphosphatase